MALRPRLGGTALAALTAALLTAPAAAATTTVPAAVECEVTGGALTWGFKESFRAYITSRIASGSWEALDGATYETPVFTWPAASGTVDPGAGTATIHYTGTVTFTGHNGLLNTTVSDPTVVIDTTGAHILLDFESIPMEDAIAGNEVEPDVFEQVSFVAMDAAASAPTFADGEITATGVPAAVTEDGFAAFSNYPAGTAFDPVDVSATFECAAPEPEPTAEPTETAEAATPAPEETTAPAPGDDAWMPWAWVGGIAAAAAAIVVGVWAARRGRRGTSGASGADGPGDPSGGAAA